jgi:transglutaminase-like putative cysteine protease
MNEHRLTWPQTAVPSLLAALTSWVSLWAWDGFVERASGFLVPTLGGVLLIAVTGMLLRSARVPALLVMLGQLVVLAIWLTHRWTPETALGGWLPTSASMDVFRGVLTSSVNAAQSFQAPVPEEVAAIHPLLIVAGVGVAVLVDFLACGLRRVPAAGLPLLAVYTAPVSILVDGVPWWVFAAGSVAFLSLLASDEGGRLAGWGRQLSSGGRISDTSSTGISTASVRSSARKIGLTATGLAVVVPVVLPTLGTGLLAGHGPGGSGDGEAVSISNPMVDLRRDLVRGADVDLVTMRTTRPDPSYLRISVLDTFTGETWKPSGRDIPAEQRAQGRLPRPPGLDADVARSEDDYELDLTSAFDSTWLPAPYPVSTIETDGDWRYDADTFDFVSATEGQNAAGATYSLSALDVAPTVDDLVDAGPSPESVFTPYTDLPNDLPESVADLARRLTDGLDSRFERAVRLQRWFREDGGFTYSLERAAGNGTEDLVGFLGTGPGSRVGYCEQFAAAMAVMGRTLGIPSRVAVGFLRPQQVGEHVYVYSAHDLHAWPEMYFDGVGWVRFEPTPAARATGVPGYTTGQVSAPEPVDTPSGAVPNQTSDAELPSRQPDAGAAAGSDGDAGSGGLGAGLLLGLGVAAVVVSPFLLRTAVRRRRWASATTPAEVAEAGWAELRDSVLDLRLPWDDAETLRTRARGVVSHFGEPDWDESQSHVRARMRGAEADPEATRALERLVEDVERARYARMTTAASGRDEAAVAADVRTCVAALHAGAGKKARHWAGVLPASLVKNRESLSGPRRRTGGVTLADAGVDRAM